MHPPYLSNPFFTTSLNRPSFLTAIPFHASSCSSNALISSGNVDPSSLSSSASPAASTIFATSPAVDV